MTGEQEIALARQRRADLEALGDKIAEQAAHLDAALHRLLTDVRAFDQGGGWFHQGARSCAQWLAWRVGWGLGTAREHVRVANRLAELPRVDDALRRGELSYSKVRAITRVATAANEEQLLELARFSTGGQLETICRKYATVQRHDHDVTPRDDVQRRFVARTDTADGMVRIVAMLDPEEAALVWAALERVAVERCRVSAEASSADAPVQGGGARAPSACGSDAVAEPKLVSAETRAPVRAFDRADALVSIADEVVRGTSRERAPTELVITVAAETLAAGSSEQADPSAVGCCGDGTCVSAEAVRRVACDCGVVEVVEDERGVPMSVGRRTRTVPGAMKRALLRRDQRCRFPGCTTRVFLDAHHVQHWADGGATEMRNLLALCTHHHRFVHEYGYQIEIREDGDPVFTDPRGRVVAEIPELPRPVDRGFPALRSQLRDLAITVDTPACGWDGQRVDYDLVIDALVRADRTASPRESPS